MGGRRDGIVSDPKTVEPDADLLEFLGGIDEVNDEGGEEDLGEVLARREVELPEKVEKPAAQKPKAPVKEEKSE